MDLQQSLQEDNQNNCNVFETSLPKKSHHHRHETGLQPPHLTSENLTIADIGELALIERLKPFCAEGEIGDDAALMDLQSDHKLVVTTDMLTENVHCGDYTMPAYTVGWRAVTSSLADLAAMGASPLGITVALGLPGQTPWPWVEDLYRGMKDCLNTQSVAAILGGDLCRATKYTISITALGQVPLE
ncbi:MAG: AIR synthase related protein [Cyanobacteria bacterium P01_F01_bin.53]